MTECNRLFKIGDRYEVLGFLGRGSHGDVLYGIDCVTNKEVAIKTVRKSSRHRCFDTLSREVAFLRKLDHPNILKLHDVITLSSSDELFLIIEYADFGPLVPDDKLGHSKPLSIPLLKNVMQQVISGLRYLHRKKIVHRDIKPSNILCIRDADGKRIVISDLSISTDTSDDSKMLAGSPMFVAPCLLSPNCPNEFRNNPVNDVYSLGVTLFILAFGSFPFGDCTDRDEVFARVKEYAAGNRSLDIPLYVDVDLEDLIRQLMHPDPKKRITLEEASRHPWLQSDNSSMYTSCSEQSDGSELEEFTQEELDNAVSIISNLVFETRQGSDMVDTKTNLAQPEQTLLLTDGVISLIMMCVRVLQLDGDHSPSTRYTQLLQDVQNFIKSPEALPGSEAQFVAVLKEYVAVLKEEIDANPFGDNCPLTQKHKKFMKRDVIPLLVSRVDQLEDTLVNQNSDTITKWKPFSIKRVTSLIKGPVSACCNNPSSQSSVVLYVNGKKVLCPIKNYSAHTIFVDIGEQEFSMGSDSFSSESSSGNDLTSTPEDIITSTISNGSSTDTFQADSIVCPSVVVDLIVSMIIDGLHFSALDSKIRMTVWNVYDAVNNTGSLRISYRDFSNSSNTSNSGIERASTLAKYSMMTCTFLNGTFNADCSSKLSTFIDIFIPCPEAFVHLLKDTENLQRLPSIPFSLDYSIDQDGARNADFKTFLTTDNSFYSTIIGSL
ncbi:hypothetical protein P9112_009284 [Eukaryota sp. TZLM1-RC]